MGSMARKRETALTRAVHEAYAAHEMFCMMGYTPDDVFIGARNVVGEGMCAVVWLRHGGLELTLPVAPLTSVDADHFRDAMVRFQEAKPSMSRAVLDRIVRGSTVMARAGEILSVMAEKGFDIERYKLREAN